MKRTVALILVLALALPLVACGAGVKDPGDYEGVNPLTEGVDADKLAEGDEPIETKDAASAMQELALKLMAASEGENPVISPLSAYFALAMAANGADGDTWKEFSRLLGAETRDDLNAAVAAVALNLAKAAENGNIFKAANSAWVDGDAAIKDDFLKALVTYYNADVYSAELETRDAMNAMNSWINKKTEGLIPSLFNEPLSRDAMLVLINTLYMKAKWASPFEKESTYNEKFRTETGDVSVPFMHASGKFEYIKGEGYVGTALYYKGDALKFVALKPTSGTARELLGKLDLSKLKGSTDYKVVLSLPKFDTEFEMDMSEALIAAGIPTAFDGGKADFSRMGTSKDGHRLYISQVLQKVKMIVDEEGTEAAAVTAVIMERATSVGPTDDPIVLKFDEPFVYMILDAETNAPVFMGVMDNPK